VREERGGLVLLLLAEVRRGGTEEVFMLVFRLVFMLMARVEPSCLGSSGNSGVKGDGGGAGGGAVQMEAGGGVNDNGVAALAALDALARLARLARLRISSEGRIN